MTWGHDLLSHPSLLGLYCNGPQCVGFSVPWPVMYPHPHPSRRSSAWVLWVLEKGLSIASVVVLTTALVPVAARESQVGGPGW